MKEDEPKKDEKIVESEEKKEAKVDFFDNFDAAFDGEYGQEVPAKPEEAKRDEKP